ncbi:MAG: hypothetical protein DPW09_13145 [Anaerolineae bacterium]|nr:hypothetical protein [Anaerolineales bacterium]MCQ3974387.1 hypothetical protein [Anaerolineae bacterium]
MPKHSHSYFTRIEPAASPHASRFTFHVREWAILGLFFLLTLVMLYPLSLNLTHMVPEPTDPLLNAWRMQWNARAFLSGPAAIADIFNTNIFYPFPLTLAYSEHFLFLSALALPLLLIADSHLWGLNVSVLLTFWLSGYAMYLLVTAWTGQPWAGLVAGLLFAFSPHRFGQLNHLELLVTQWLPLTLLALHWTLTRPGWRYPLLFGLFFNFQMLSDFHFGLSLTLACALLALVYTLSRRVRWRRGLFIAAVLSILATLLLNWPIWRMYLHFSEVMGAVRTPGEVRIYSATLTDYFTTIPHNLLYGWTFNHWPAENHQIQPLMPFGLAGLALALIGLLAPLLSRKRSPAKIISRTPSSSQSPISNLQSPISILYLLSTLLLFLLLSFGLNEAALGPTLAPLLKYSPYPWLYEHLTLFQGIRVPGRFGIMVVVALTTLAGWGAATLLRTMHHASRITHHVSVRSLPVGRLTFLLLPFLLLEAWSAPLVGPEFPTGSTIPAVYSWLRRQTPAESVVLELPYGGASEFLYEYYSSHHWRQLANGGTGYTPPIYRDMRRWWATFPDPRSVDAVQQLGVDYVILHADRYKPEDWQQLLADLPAYLPAFSQINQVDNALILQVAGPACSSGPDDITVTLTPTAELDGWPQAMKVTYQNDGQAAFVADVGQTSRLTFADGTGKNFTEPLITPAGESQSIIVPLRIETSLTGAWLASLDRQISAEAPPAEAAAPLDPMETGEWQPLGLQFMEGPQLAAIHVGLENATSCSTLRLALKWNGGQPDDSAVVQLLDPFGRLVFEDTAQPWLSAEAGESMDSRALPLPGSLPAGRYGLRVYVRTAEGQERLPVTAEGVTIPTNQIPPLPLVIQPVPPTGYTAEPDGATFGETIRLVGKQLSQSQVAAGDWLRFSLIWQADHTVETDLTVFTQLLGPDGQVWGQRDNQPKGGWYSLSWWSPGQPVADDYAFQVSPDAPPGTYRLIAGWYNPATLTRLSTATGQDFVEIGTVEIKEAVRQE